MKSTSQPNRLRAPRAIHRHPVETAAFPHCWARASLLMVAVLAFVAACASIGVKEAAGPATSEPMATPGPYHAEYVTTAGHEGARQPFALLRPEHPFASVILFSGGDGAINLSPDRIRRGGNFLVRSRELFAQQGLMVAVVDVPTDRSTLNEFRTGKAHALDIKSVIAYLREQAHVPVWLVGTSYGTVSAVKVADWLADGGGPDGVVLTSTLFVPRRLGASLFHADPARVRVPLLLLHHRSDRCPSTPFRQADGYVKRM